MSPIVITLAILLSIALGVVLTLYIHPSRRMLSERTRQLAECGERLAVAEGQVAELRAENAERGAKEARLQERIASLEPLVERTEQQQSKITALSTENATLREQLRQESEQRNNLRRESEQTFKELATAILDEKSQTFKKSNEERLGEILAPFKANLESLQKKIDDCYTGEVSEVKSLRDSLKQLTELNATISREARELTDALRGNSKVQGDWGEMILDSLLENSGLQKGIHYSTQESIKDEQGRNQRPDVVLSLPDGKVIIVDSKVSLTAFVNWSAAEEPKEQEAAMAAHVASVSKHVQELSAKRYQDLTDKAPEFVIMFVPNEPAFMYALQNEPNLWADAYKKNVVISSPTNLLAMLRIVYDLWQRDSQNKNALKIADAGGKLYDKVVGFVETLGEVEKNIGKAADSCTKAIEQLSTGRGNILSRVENLKVLGAKASKRLPESLVQQGEEE